MLSQVSDFVARLWLLMTTHRWCWTSWTYWWVWCLHTSAVSARSVITVSPLHSSLTLNFTDVSDFLSFKYRRGDNGEMVQKDSLEWGRFCPLQLSTPCCHDCWHECVGTCDDVASQKCLSDLLQVFDDVLLPTHASRYVQFIVFYVASLSQVSVLLYSN